MITVDVLIDGKVIPMPAHYEQKVDWLTGGAMVTTGPWERVPDCHDYFVFQKTADGAWHGTRTRL